MKRLTSYPHDKHLHWLAGWWLILGQNQPQRAVVMFERVMQIDPKFADAYNEAAYCYAKQGNFDKAFADIKRYTELVPNEPNPQDTFAEISRMAGRFEDALTHYRMSLKIDPTFHESQLGLGDTYALMGDQAKARAEYDKGHCHRIAGAESPVVTAGRRNVRARRRPGRRRQGLQRRRRAGPRQRLRQP